MDPSRSNGPVCCDFLRVERIRRCAVLEVRNGGCRPVEIQDGKAMPEETEAFIQSHVRLDRDVGKRLLVRFVDSYRKSSVPDTATINALVLVKCDQIMLMAPKPHGD